MITSRIFFILAGFISLQATCFAGVTNHYLFLGHPRADGPGEIVQREVEQVKFRDYDLLLLGGDYTFASTAARSTADYLLCLAGDRTGSDMESFYIDYTTAEGVHFTAAGLKEDLPAELRTAVVLEHDVEAGTLTWEFKPVDGFAQDPG